MEEKNNSFLLFLSIVLALLLVSSIAFSYFFGNFGGVSIKELKSAYVTKESINFGDLPLEIQKNYIKKDEIKFKPKTNIGLEKVFDEQGNPLEIIEGDVDDLQSIIKSLQDRVLFLEQENIFISNDKNELLKIVQNEKSTRQIEESTLLSKNLEKINEAEKQHYQNISELTMKINDLQRENIALSDQRNSEKQLLQDEITTLQQKLEEEKNKAELSTSEELKKEYIKYENLQKQKDILALKVDELTKQLKELRESQIIVNAKKDKDIVDLQNKINTLIMEKNTLLTQKSQSVIDMEKKYSSKLQEVEESIKKYQDEKIALKNSYETKIQKDTSEYMKLINELRAQNAKLQEELNKVSQNSIAILENSEKSLQDKELEYTKLLEELKNKFNANLASITEEKSTLTQELKNANAVLEKLKIELESYHLSSQKLNDEILQLNDKIVTLETQNRSIDDEVNEQIELNETKHNKNYKFLNEKIAALTKKLNAITTRYQDEIKEYKNSLNTELDASKQKYAVLNQDLFNLKKALQSKEKEVENLNQSLEELHVEKAHLEKNEHEKLIEIRKSFEELQAEVDKRETVYKAQIDKLKNELDAKNSVLRSNQDDKEKLTQYLNEIATLKKTLQKMDGKIVSSDTVPISDKKRKLALLDSIECGDMNSGNFQVTSTCKEKVAKFLSNYSEDNYFEVIPIVGTGGFSSLNKLRNNTQANVPNTEIDRLTELANLGLGKHRAKEGGWLIREQFGDFAKISYTVYNIEAEGKRGFVIRVYR
jgi:phosphohistidine swiveling domain-containing protein